MIKYIFVAPDGAVTHLGEYPNVLSKDMLDAMMANKFKFLYEQYNKSISHYAQSTEEGIVVVVLPAEQVTVAQANVLQNPKVIETASSYIERMVMSASALGANLAEARKNMREGLGGYSVFNRDVIKYVLLFSNGNVRYLTAGEMVSFEYVFEEVRKVFPNAVMSDWRESKYYGTGTEIAVAFIFHFQTESMAKAECENLYKQIQYSFYAGSVSPQSSRGSGPIGLDVPENIAERQLQTEKAREELFKNMGISFEAKADIHRANMADNVEAYKDLLEWEESQKPELDPEESILTVIYEGNSPIEAAVVCAARDAVDCWRSCNSKAEPDDADRYFLYDLPNDKIIIVDLWAGGVKGQEAVAKFISDIGLVAVGRGDFPSKEWNSIIALNVVPVENNVNSSFMPKDYAIREFMDRYDSIMAAVEPTEVDPTEVEDNYASESERISAQESEKREAELKEARKSDQERQKDFEANYKRQSDALERIAKTMETMLWEYRRK